MSTAPVPSPQHGHGFRHEALFYAGDDGFTDATLPFIGDAVAAGDAILVAVSPAKIERLRGALNGAAEHVRFADMEELGANPARIIPAWRDFVDEHGGGGRTLRGIGEPVWPGRSGDELAECRRHEALLNVAFGDREDFWLMCPYDTGAVGPDVVAGACRSHPVLVEDGVERTSHEYRAPDRRELLSEPLAEPGRAAPAQPLPLPFEALTLTEVRRHTLDLAREAGLDPIRSEELQLAVSEIAANSVRHAGGTGELRLWTEPDSVVAEVRDPGRIDDPLAGRRRPEIDQLGGYGLWIANQLCDLVQIRSTEDGNVVRLHMRRPALSLAKTGV